MGTLVFLGHSAPVRVIPDPALLPAPGVAHSCCLQTQNHRNLQHDVSDWEWSIAEKCKSSAVSDPKISANSGGGD